MKKVVAIGIALCAVCYAAIAELSKSDLEWIHKASAAVDMATKSNDFARAKIMFEDLISDPACPGWIKIKRSVFYNTIDEPFSEAQLQSDYELWRADPSTLTNSIWQQSFAGLVHGMGSYGMLPGPAGQQAYLDILDDTIRNVLKANADTPEVFGSKAVLLARRGHLLRGMRRWEDAIDSFVAAAAYTRNTYRGPEGALKNLHWALDVIEKHREVLSAEVVNDTVFAILDDYAAEGGSASSVIYEAYRAIDRGAISDEDLLIKLKNLRRDLTANYVRSDTGEADGAFLGRLKTEIDMLTGE